MGPGGGSAHLATADPFQAQLAQAALDGAAGHTDPLSTQLRPHLTSAIDPEAVLVDGSQLQIWLSAGHRD